MRRLFAFAFLCIAACARAVEPLDFAKDILPILERNCLPCHNSTKSEGELNIETPKLMMKGGEHGPVIVPHKAAESLFYRSAAKTKKPYMPPAENKSKAQPLTSLQLELLRRWIDEGAVGEGKKREAPKWQAMPASIGRVSALAVSEDGALVAAARGGRVAIYDLNTKQVAMELPRDAHRDVVSSLAFSPDALTLATGSFGEVKLWSRAAPAMSPEREAAMKRLMAEHEQMATAFELTYQQGEKTKTEAQLKAFEEDAKKAATELADIVKRQAQIAKAVMEAQKKLEMASATREKSDGSDKKLTDEVNTAMKVLSEAKSEVGKSVDAERAAKKSSEDVAETKTKLVSIGKALADAQKAADAATKALAAHGEAKAVPAEAPVKWELKRMIGDPTKTNSPLTDRVNAVAFSPDGKLFATGSGDPSRSGEIKLWDATTFKLVREFAKPHKDVVLCLDFSADGKLLASGSADRAVRLWDLQTGKMIRSLEAHSNHVLGVSFRNDARVLASVSADASVKTWSLATGDVIKTVSDFKKEITGVRFIGYKNEIMGAAGDPMLWVLNDEGGTVRRDEKSFAAFLTCSSTTTDGRVQVVGDVKGKVWVLDAKGKVVVSW